MIQCSRCGTENQAGARFCNVCGNALSGGQTPPPAGRPQSGTGIRVGSLLIGGLCVIYLLNPTLGLFELIPDNLPIIGNLDEAGAVAGLLMALNNLGLISFKLRP
jgi:hypothetical protein